MNISQEVVSLVERIDVHVNSIAMDDAGNQLLRASLADYMESFDKIMTSTTDVELDHLCNQYAGFYRFGKLLEDIALGESTSA